jgi:hypothetical protein
MLVAATTLHYGDLALVFRGQGNIPTIRDQMHLSDRQIGETKMSSNYSLSKDREEWRAFVYKTPMKTVFVSRIFLLLQKTWPIPLILHIARLPLCMRLIG